MSKVVGQRTAFGWLLSGPIQCNSFYKVMNVLTTMRKYRLVFGSDIIKMFRQIRVHEDDWDLQRILWVDANQQKIIYQLTTVTYDLNCSPWLSLRVLQQLAEDEGDRFPAAVETITNGRYVDDIYGGAESAEDFKEIATQLQGLCHAGGFSLQKWSSNCPEILHELGLSTEAMVQFEKSITKLLGSCWHQASDTFRYKSRKFNSAVITKRVLSSEIAQIFDPLGFIAPVVVQEKILLQELWKIKVNWDDQLPDNYKERWTTFRKDLNDLDKLSVPRWLRLSTETSNIQLHGFADTSEAAMSAVVYIRTENINEPTSTILVGARTKVAPIKPMTIPRLELTAALLQMLQLDQVETYLWSDSSVTLAWRPEWINQDPDDWPRSSIDATALDNPEVAKEVKPTPAHPVALQVNRVGELLNRYSKLEKLLAVTSTINRAIDRFRRQPVSPGPVLITEELNDARLFWAKLTQHQYFAADLRALHRNHQLPRNHQLANLTPVLDHQGIMGLEGRLKNSQLNPDENPPIILPRKSRFTTLMIEEAYRKILHGRIQFTLAHTRQWCWIIGGRGTVRAYILRCAVCARHRGKLAQQQMGQLPATRISPARAFLHTAVDYAGPFDILKWRPTNAQPAVHLELGNRQTTATFTGAYKRFTGRRGIPAVMYSDNATTFFGAADILEKIYRQPSEENQRVQAALATHGTQWSFSPPRVPHFGGKWEAAVKSTKHHLKRVLGSTTLTYEELNSMIIQIEACLNSRPICLMSDDPDDLQALTAGHFLIGEPLQLIPEPSIINENPIKLQRWNLVT
ncbi:uncharacterized protein LOC107042495 [Diachasma alloeum]|uniref:uncharacterized protein LOC107042495 n=1 Tax=Diachasma alloeum TaxID=454923 RepID=UPI0007384FBB|nr:uncharacterized protein LOC107042495 [Diachasma alloeum]